jgi:hypothetical protein
MSNYKSRISKLIHHEFFKAGHGEIKCDSVHSKLSTGQKYACYVPQGSAKVIQSAKQNQVTFVLRTILYDRSHDFGSVELICSKNSIEKYAKCFINVIIMMIS